MRARSTFPIPVRGIQRRSPGFTLLEILITALILSVGILTLTHAYSTGMLASTYVENVDLALNLAQGKMEVLENTAFSSLTSSGPASDPNFSNFDVTVTVTGVDPKTLEVKVGWKVKGGTADVALTTLRADV